MGDAVAIGAFRELGHDSCCVWYTMAILAFRYHLVLLLVTGHAEKSFVFGLAGTKQAECLAVTGGTLFGRRISSIDYCLRHVCLVAFFAVTRALVGRVSLVALGTLRNLAMDVVAEGTGELAVLARAGLELGNLR